MHQNTFSFKKLILISIAHLCLITILDSRPSSAEEAALSPTPLKPSSCTQELRTIAAEIGQDDAGVNAERIADALTKAATCIDEGRFENIRGPIVADAFLHRKPSTEEASDEE